MPVCGGLAVPTRRVRRHRCLRLTIAANRTGLSLAFRQGNFQALDLPVDVAQALRVFIQSEQAHHSLLQLQTRTLEQLQNERDKAKERWKCNVHQDRS